VTSEKIQSVAYVESEKDFNWQEKHNLKKDTPLAGFW
jgi:hypothetical protein